MYATDFEYDGLYLSDYNFIVCRFDYSNSADIINAGAVITFNKTARNRGKIFSLTSTKYESCIQTTFDICKNPDIFDGSDRIITQDEYRDLMRWLNRHNYLKFQFLNDEESLGQCYFHASFNIEQIKIGDRLYGLRLSMETDCPFGYGDTQTVALNFTASDSTKVVYDCSDEVGYLYPNLTITCCADGDIIIYNDSQNCHMEIKNCVADEVIYINGSVHTISSSETFHDIANDFNYDFLKIGNTLNDRSNVIRVSQPCNIVMEYTPIIKGVLC